jgi:hypothetical protein
VLGDAELALRLPADIPATHLDTVAERLSDAKVDALLQTKGKTEPRLKQEFWCFAHNIGV